MHLGSGQCHSLQGIKYGHACVGIGSRVDEYAVEHTIRCLNLVYYHTLMVRLEQFNLERQLRRFSYVSLYAQKTICGKGFDGYKEGLEYLAQL